MVDIGAALTTGQMKFWISLCRKFPWIVQEIIVAKNCGYQPLRLSGIVTNDTQGATSAELPVVLKLRMPYLLHDSTRRHPVTLGLVGECLRVPLWYAINMSHSYCTISPIIKGEVCCEW